jgi:hypothetical protein
MKLITTHSHLNIKYVGCTIHFPVLVAMWSKAKVCSYLIAGIMGLSLAEGVDVHLLCLLCVV